jgi:DNA-binding NtrC family response regulator
MARILVVDDDASIRRMLVRGLSAADHEPEEAPDGRTAIARLQARQYEVVLTDVRMAEPDGLEVLRRAMDIQPCPAVILMSGHGTIQTAVDAIHTGAFDFIEKPFTLEHLQVRLQRALELRRLRHQVSYLNRTQPDIYAFDRIIGADGSLKPIIDMVRKVAPSGATVLIGGETGTGKELIAAALHHNSTRATRALVKVNCAALHEQLLESELFGHEKGAFTGADRQRIGRFEQADGGTLFLDEIGDMSPATQAKVLRVLQQREFERLGSSRTIRVDVRLVAATHRHLEDLIAAGRFRADLFYRLNVVRIDLPPLRARKADIPALAATFVRRFARDLKRPVQSLAPDTLAALGDHDWPGNIRELENVIERAVLMAEGPVLRPEDLLIAAG